MTKERRTTRRSPDPTEPVELVWCRQAKKVVEAPHIVFDYECAYEHVPILTAPEQPLPDAGDAS